MTKYELNFSSKNRIFPTLAIGCKTIEKISFGSKNNTTKSKHKLAKNIIVRKCAWSLVWQDTYILMVCNQVLVLEIYNTKWRPCWRKTRSNTIAANEILLLGFLQHGRRDINCKPRYSDSFYHCFSFCYISLKTL